MRLMTTHPLQRALRRVGPLVALAGMVLVIVLLATWAATAPGERRPASLRLPSPLPPRTLVPREALPPGQIPRYFALDPAVIDYLDSRQPDYLPAPLPMDAELPPIGAYLPSTVQSLAELPTSAAAIPTPAPSASPVVVYVTTTPLPVTPATTPPPTFPPPTPRPFVGPNSECAPSGLPVGGVLTQYFHAYHEGIDLAAPLGTPVVATHSGTVTYAGWSDIGYGYLVTLRSGGFTTYYAHNTSIVVLPNQFVERGSVLAWSGSTGNSSGPHVHYETRIHDVPVDPLTFEARGYPTC